MMRHQDSDHLLHFRPLNIQLGQHWLGYCVARTISGFLLWHKFRVLHNAVFQVVDAKRRRLLNPTSRDGQSP